MSHRIATQTKITDKSLAETALKQKGWRYDITGSSIYIHSGPMARTTINLQTGEVVGDTDRDNQTSLMGLNQAYAEASLMRGLNENGGYVESREELANGDLRIVTCSQA